MTEVLVAIVGVVGLVVPALLTRPIGPHKHLAAMRQEAEAYDALPADAKAAREVILRRINASARIYSLTVVHGTVVGNAVLIILGGLLASTGFTLFLHTDGQGLLPAGIILIAVFGLLWGLAIMLIGVKNSRDMSDDATKQARARAETAEAESYEPYATQLKEAEDELARERTRLAVVVMRTHLMLARVRRQKMELELEAVNAQLESGDLKASDLAAFLDSDWKEPPSESAESESSAEVSEMTSRRHS